MTMTSVIRLAYHHRLSTRNLFTTTITRLYAVGGDDYREVNNFQRKRPLDRPTRSHTHGHIVKQFTTKTQFELTTSFDIVIIGGSVIGSSVAYWLKQNPRGKALNIIVIEKDPTYTRASATLSAGGIRQQFSLRENIEMSMFGAHFLREIPTKLAVHEHNPPDVQFNPNGYLLLATEKGAEQLQINYKLQRELGSKVQLLTQTKLKERFPWLNCDDIELGSIGDENEGWFDAWTLLFALKEKAMALGAQYVKAEVIGFHFLEKRDRISTKVKSEFDHGRLDKLIVRTESGKVKEIKFGVCVIAAGHDSGRVADLAGIGQGWDLLSVSLPVERRKRYIYCFHSPHGPGTHCPLVIDPSGAYFRREGHAGLYITGQSPSLAEEPNTDNLDVDYSFFDNTVWPNIANRVPSFEKLKIKSGWAGYYDYNKIDQNAIIGPHPYHKNLYFATGFSGHGLQQAPATGRAIMELIIHGEYRTIGLTRFQFDRFITGKEVKEQNIY